MTLQLQVDDFSYLAAISAAGSDGLWQTALALLTLGLAFSELLPCRAQDPDPVVF